MIGELIKKARIDKNMTTSDISVVIGVSQGYISKIELNQKQPSLPLLKKLSETLEIPYDELLIASGYLDKSKYLGLMQENNQLREALEFYANENSHFRVDSYAESIVMQDKGKIARQTLDGEAHE